jgi:hypothetical protein
VLTRVDTMATHAAQRRTGEFVSKNTLPNDILVAGIYLYTIITTSSAAVAARAPTAGGLVAVSKLSYHACDVVLWIYL